jgi:DNA-binding phage protein
MSKRISLSTLPPFDAALFLVDEDSIDVYLREIRASNDAVLLASAIKDVERARLMNQFARPLD